MADDPTTWHAVAGCDTFSLRRTYARPQRLPGYVDDLQPPDS